MVLQAMNKIHKIFDMIWYDLPQLCFDKKYLITRKKKSDNTDFHVEKK